MAVDYMIGLRPVVGAYESKARPGTWNVTSDPEKVMAEPDPVLGSSVEEIRQVLLRRYPNITKNIGYVQEPGIYRLPSKELDSASIWVSPFPVFEYPRHREQKGLPPVTLDEIVQAIREFGGGCSHLPREYVEQAEKEGRLERVGRCAVLDGDIYIQQNGCPRLDPKHCARRLKAWRSKKRREARDGKVHSDTLVALQQNLRKVVTTLLAEHWIAATGVTIGVTARDDKAREILILAKFYDTFFSDTDWTARESFTMETYDWDADEEFQDYLEWMNGPHMQHHSDTQIKFRIQQKKEGLLEAARNPKDAYDNAINLLTEIVTDEYREHVEDFPESEQRIANRLIEAYDLLT